MISLGVAVGRGFDQLKDKKTRGVMWLSVAVTLGIFIATWLGIYFLITLTTLVGISWLEGIIDILGGAAAFVLTWFLFPPVVIAVSSLFLDAVVEAVEARHYPDLPMAKGLTIAQSIGPALKLLGMALFLNLLCLPFIFTPFYPFLYYTLNGYLLGREYFELVAFRRLDKAEGRIFFRQKKWPIIAIGALFAFFLTIPILNLITPVVATAALVHLFEGWRGNRPGRVVDMETTS